MGVTTMKVGGRSSILSITSATHGHSGEYTCDATNAAGKQRYSASLTVHGTYIQKMKSSFLFYLISCCY